jgi:hypothetical protein
MSELRRGWVTGSDGEPEVCGEAFLDEGCRKPEKLRAESKDPSPITPEYLPLDHPHVEPDCGFCAARQAPRLHRLWCGVFFVRGCDCGYESR